LTFVALYAAVRFVLEFWRSDDRGSLLGLSTSQWLGLVLLGGALALHRRRSSRGTQPAEAAKSA
jgi:phosphatidylglycerol:prolipoprotein diacylglycerol transferase